jgi:hypothetical protein
MRQDQKGVRKMPPKITGAIGNATDRRLEVLVERFRKKFHRDNAADGEKIHYTVDLNDNPRLQAFNKIMKKQALRKVN